MQVCNINCRVEEAFIFSEKFCSGGQHSLSKWHALVKYLEGKVSDVVVFLFLAAGR